MEYRTLGRDLRVSAVGLGCMGMSHAYGAPLEKKEAVLLIREAADMGYTFFDTAEVYGTEENPHENEELVGKALKSCRDKVVIATKFGIHFDMSSSEVNKPLVPDSRPETIRASVEASLKRLDTDYIDLYYQDRMDPEIPVEEVAGAENGILKIGKLTDFQAHQIEHQLGAYTDCNHGHGLAVIHPVLYRHMYKDGVQQFARMAEKVWEVPAEGRSLEELAEAGIQALADFIREIGLPSTFAEMGITDKSVLKKVADTCNLTAGCCKKLSREEILEILEECW